jgi:hypothetical protein
MKQEKYWVKYIFKEVKLMKKMTKIESAKIIVKQAGSCNIPVGVLCSECFNFKKCGNNSALYGLAKRYADAEKYIKRHEKDLAKAYIKRHEAKSRKKKVEETKEEYTADIKLDLTGSKLIKIKMTNKPTPLEIAKMIRDNGYKCVGLDNFMCCECPIYEQNCKNEVIANLIDNYIAENTPCKHLFQDSCMGEDKCDNLNCPAYGTEPQPIKFEDPMPEYVYTITEYGIFRFTALRFESEKAKGKDGTITKKEKVVAFEGQKEIDGTNEEVTIDIESCYRTLEEAVKVAEKKWSAK